MYQLHLTLIEVTIFFIIGGDDIFKGIIIDYCFGFLVMKASITSFRFIPLYASDIFVTLTLSYSVITISSFLVLIACIAKHLSNLIVHSYPTIPLFAFYFHMQCSIHIQFDGLIWSSFFHPLLSSTEYLFLVNSVLLV